MAFLLSNNFSSLLSLCLLVAVLPLVVWGQGTSIIELRESMEPAGTDHTGDIVSFTAVGSGAEGTSPRPWVCYTINNPTNVEWQTPDGVTIPTGSNVAPDDSVVTRTVGGGLVLSRGTNYISPDGDYCCVLTMDGTESERRCVTFTPCPTLDTPTNGRITYDPVTNVATYDCDTGYTSTGNRQITCESDGSSVGSWTGSVTCTIVTCPFLTHPDNGEVLTSNNNYLSIAIYTCTSGYVLTPSDGGIRICGEDGEWSEDAPTCPPVDCGSLTITNGMVDTSSGTTFMNTATYSCNPGYILIGTTNRMCQSDAVWSSTAPTCEILCLITEDTLTNGMISYSDSRRPIVAGTVATYTCDTGYTLDGADTRTCVDTPRFSGWSSEVPTCIIVDCGPLTNVANGTVDISSGTTYQETAIYTCYDGYQHIGAITRMCLGDGLWSASEPTCEFILLSPGNTVYSNNTVISVSTILEAGLNCHTELTTCCRVLDNPTREALGDWIGPDGNSLPETSEEGFYVTRDTSSVSLNLNESSGVTAGSYCCQVPRSGGRMSTHCIMVTVPVLPTESACTESVSTESASTQSMRGEDQALLPLRVLLGISVVVNIALGSIIAAFLIFKCLKIRNKQIKYNGNFNVSSFKRLFNTNNEELPQEPGTNSTDEEIGDSVYETMDPEEPATMDPEEPATMGPEEPATLGPEEYATLGPEEYATIDPETSECLAYTPSNMTWGEPSKEAESPSTKEPPSIEAEPPSIEAEPPSTEEPPSIEEPPSTEEQ